MQTTPPFEKPSIHAVTAVFASAGLGLVLASAFAVLACSGGLLFSGISTFSTILVTAVVCAIATPVTALVFKRKQRCFGWRTLLIEVSVLAFVAVGTLSWLDTRQQLQIFMKPGAVPAGIRVHQGRSILFGGYVHFTGPPAAISSLLQSKGLIEIPAESLETQDVSAFSSRERTKSPWGWWQPATMSDPRFFFRSHKSDAVQGWCEGWWVNGATNEVFAFISG